MRESLHAEWTKLRTLASTFWLLLNAAALAAGYIYFSQYWGEQTEQEREATQTELAAWQARAAAPEAAEPAKPLIVYQTNDFRWSQLESTDYRQYIANLRAIGCPELTLRDIIMTDFYNRETEKD